jgi:glycine cleavage system transcriptional repressor
MQLTITALGNKSTHFIAEILATISSCQCNVLDLKSSNLAQSTATYLLVDGDWNQIAKVENLLDILQKQLEIQINTLRPEPSTKKPTSLPYSLETISIDRHNVLEDITNFLYEREISIEDIRASSYPAPYIQTLVFSTKLIILIPPQVRLLVLREEFLDFCDTLNIDAIFEPIKH